jgi:lactoylglutathione lyase
VIPYLAGVEQRSRMINSPVILRFHNTWLILSTEGDPTDDRPGVAAVAPHDSETLTSALNLRVANIPDKIESAGQSGACVSSG